MTFNWCKFLNLDLQDDADIENIWDVWLIGV